jgi:hypothetical protein
MLPSARDVISPWRLNTGRCRAGTLFSFVTAADLMLQIASTKSQDRLNKHFNHAVLSSRLRIVDENGHSSCRITPGRTSWFALVGSHGHSRCLRKQAASRLACHPCPARRRPGVGIV